jgi:translation initiation factor 2 beta subunit (eIF-2beta)/eIF-5
MVSAPYTEDKADYARKKTRERKINMNINTTVLENLLSRADTLKKSLAEKTLTPEYLDLLSKQKAIQAAISAATKLQNNLSGKTLSRLGTRLNDAENVIK